MWLTKILRFTDSPIILNSNTWQQSQLWVQGMSHTGWPWRNFGIFGPVLLPATLVGPLSPCEVTAGFRKPLKRICVCMCCSGKTHLEEEEQPAAVSNQSFWARENELLYTHSKAWVCFLAALQSGVWSAHRNRNAYVRQRWMMESSGKAQDFEVCGSTQKSRCKWPKRVIKEKSLTEEMLSLLLGECR